MKTEQQTRIELIDAALQKAGWNVNDPGQVVQEYDILVESFQMAEVQTPYGGHQFSDYVLLGRDRKPLAVVEAKKTSKDAALGREQAKQYCCNIHKEKGGELPFCFYTNGLEIHFWDLGNHPPRRIVGFPTLDDLERYLYIRRQKKILTAELINTEIAGRDYQIRAIRSVLEGIERKRRAFLLVMATGTGKTRTAIALIDALMRAAHIERALFLVDRIALREQALSAFKEHLPNEPRWLEPAKIRPWCPEKDVFLILDCWDNFEYFKLQPKGKTLAPQLPLPVRLVGIRLDKIEKGLTIEQFDIAAKEIAALRHQIQELPQSSVIIIEAATVLSQIADDNYWINLTAQKLEFLRNEIKPLFRTVSQVDFKAMRFTKDVLEISLALLSGEKEKFATLREGLIEQIGQFPLSVNIVARQRILIETAQQHHCWGACTDATLDELAEKLSPLMKFRERPNGGDGPVNLNTRQLEFLRLLKEFITEREIIEKRDLIQSPFTIIHPQGIRGVFRPAEIEEILQLTEKLAA